MKKNRKAAGTVLNSILAAFAILEAFHNSESGSAGGHFKSEWEALCKWYEDVEGDDVDVMKTDYYKMKMSLAEQPSVSMVKMKRSHGVGNHRRQ